MKAITGESNNRNVNLNLDFTFLFIIYIDDFLKSIQLTNKSIPETTMFKSDGSATISVAIPTPHPP